MITFRPALLVSGVLLGLDAIACQVLALFLVLPTWFSLLPDGAAGLTPVAWLGAAVVLALWCPAAATLVLGVRTRTARLLGLTTAAILVVAAAALAADGLRAAGDVPFQLLAGLATMVVNLGVVALLVTPAAGPVPEPFPAAPPRVIDLDL